MRAFLQDLNNAGILALEQDMGGSHMSCDGSGVKSRAPWAVGVGRARAEDSLSVEAPVNMADLKHAARPRESMPDIVPSQMEDSPIKVGDKECNTDMA